MRATNVRRWAPGMLAMLVGVGLAVAQESSIRVQCPATTILHPSGGAGIKCAHLMAGDGMVTMANDATDGVPGGKQIYTFGFSPIALPADAPVSLAEYPGWVMSEGTLAANAPAPTIEVDEDDEVFITLTNVGMALRPDLFDPHSIHWHGFPNAASIFDGVPDSSISINMGASFTYYYYPRDAGTYMYHCHVEAAEHMQMGMVGNLYVRPRQNKCGTLGHPACPAGDPAGTRYAYNDGDGTTRYDKEYPLHIGSFDANFHDQHLGVQPLPFAGMKDTFFLLNGRGYPDTVDPGVISTVDPLGRTQYSQPVSSLITATPGQRVLLRISNLNVTKFDTIATNGIPMEVIGLDARLLRDGAGNNLYYRTSSLTLGGGQSADVILDTTGLISNSTYFLYTTNLDRLANDAENFGGLMTEIRIN